MSDLGEAQCTQLLEALSRERLSFDGEVDSFVKVFCAESSTFLRSSSEFSIHLSHAIRGIAAGQLGTTPACLVSEGRGFACVARFWRKAFRVVQDELQCFREAVLLLLCQHPGKRKPQKMLSFAGIAEAEGG